MQPTAGSVAAASGRIDALAKATKRAGDARPLDHIRADLFLGMTDGTYTGLDEAAIIGLFTTTPGPNVDQPDNDDSDPTTTLPARTDTAPRPTGAPLVLRCAATWRSATGTAS